MGAEPSFKAAALLSLGDLFANREAVVAGQTFGVNPTAENLLRPYVRTGQYEKATAGMLASKWAKQVKGRAIRLAEQMRTGR